MTFEEIIKDISQGKVKLHELDKFLKDSNKATMIRRLFLEKSLNVKLEHIGHYSIDFNDVIGHNCENTIGVIQIPVGIVGPLLIHGDYAKGYFYIPLATTEGALIASVNRGAKIVTECGGARCKVLRDGMTRAPLFKLSSVIDAYEFTRWVNEHFKEIKREAEATSRFAKLLRIEPYVIGNNVWLRFVFTTGDAMGMNMVTIAVDKAISYILNNYSKARLVTISGNLCIDKKPGIVNVLQGRGKTVISEVSIPRKYLNEKFNLEPEHVVEINVRKNLLGSSLAGSVSHNAHFANIIAAIFIATGQDVAQVVESSIGFTWSEVVNDHLYFSITLPSLEIGTIGGGTRLPCQKEALSILGVAGSGDPPGTNALKFAEIIAATVLAGELNLLIALARNELARAHEKYGRGK